MKEIFRKESLAIDYDKHDWQGAIKVVGDLLVKMGSIEVEYIQAMIEAVEQYGPYMVIAPHLAIAHGAPGKHVIKDDLVVVVFKEPVYFGSPNDPVYLMLGISALSPHRHLEQLQVISDLFEDENAWERLYHCDDVEELYGLLNQ